MAKTMLNIWKNLKNFYQRIREKGLTLAAEKCEFEKGSIEFFGHMFSKDGLSPAPSKLESIQKMPPPASASEVRSLLGMTNYCGQRFIKHYATHLTHLLRETTRNGVPFAWNDVHEKVLETLNVHFELTKSHALNYFSPQWETEIYVGSSPVGISVILMQKDPSSDVRYNINFASRALTPNEQRYLQIESEALDVVCV